MKQKKFFCDYFDKYQSRLIILLLPLLIISCIISYDINHKTYLNEVQQYKEYDYTYLNEIANNIWNKNDKTLSFSNVPEDISITDFIYTKGNISFRAIEDKDFNFVSNPAVSVTISQKINKIDISPLNKKFAINKTTLIILSICFGLLAILIPFFFIYICLVLCYEISNKRKKTYCYNKRKE